ncbi:MAG TPA: hypothetical protein VGI70_04210 [Polyangiales bacterium]|jgi:hypothetical protein
MVSNLSSGVSGDKRVESSNMLDRDRAASMADEGGVSGAIYEGRQHANLAARARASERGRRIRLWGAVALGCTLLAGVVVMRARTR